MNDLLEQSFRTHKILALSMAGTLLVYALVVEILKLSGVRGFFLAAPVLAYLRFGFVFFSFAAYFIIKTINKKVLAKKPGDSYETLVGRLGRANFITLALAELPALMGLILFLSSGDSRDFYLLMLISLILMYVFYPRYSYWAYYAKALDYQGARNELV